MNERIPSGHLQDVDWTVASAPNPHFHTLKSTDTAEPQTGCADSIEKLTRKIQL